MRWVMKITPTPSAAEPARRSRTAGRGWRRRAPTWTRRGSGSAGRRTSARTMPHACRSLSESSSTGASSGSGRAEQLGEHVRRRARASRRRRRGCGRPSTPSQMFSSTDLRLRDEHLLEHGHDPGVQRRPRVTGSPSTAARQSSIVPCVGRWTPLRILTSVLLPEPFSPTSAWTSPARSSNEHAAAPASARTPSRAPNRPQCVRDVEPRRGGTSGTGCSRCSRDVCDVRPRGRPPRSRRAHARCRVARPRRLASPGA